ncbi:hypothetical protein L1765_12265 [Microaerobacter geothermalis]|uniref:hypothetical protein n=1 Tax=Microaerobacter geothermalis TaxID=674972 RepID=UPI001F3369C3|nr:hypothetical protein [Microaerobacter geothermalis]MCF6094735.1 hypothetical protein [Microaerobacter geothermalis]
MKLKIKDSVRQDFFRSAKQCIIKDRAISTDHILQKIKVDSPVLFKRLVSLKIDLTEAANILLTELSQEGWLAYRNKKWTIKKTSKFCRYCASPIGDIYIRSEKGNRYCSRDCYEELDIDEDDSPYWEDYLYLFDYFRKLYPYH